MDLSTKSLKTKIKWAVFISGNGSNLQVLLDHQDNDFEVGLVVSSKAQAFGLERAQKAGVPTLVLPPKILEADWNQLTQQLQDLKIDFIFLLGFLKIIPPSFVQKWTQKMLNLHPSLLPLYPGLKSIEKSYQDGAAMGATVHWVTEGLDEGEILFQEACIQANANHQAHALSLEEAEQKVHELEHQLVLKTVLFINSQFKN